VIDWNPGKAKDFFLLAFLRIGRSGVIFSANILNGKHDEVYSEV
jgi:hypothetical protein